VSWCYLFSACSLLGKTFSLPNIKLPFLYYNISRDCLRIDTCVEMGIPAIDVTKSFRAYIELDPCNFVVKAAFEKWEYQIILFEYDWGRGCNFICSM